MTHLSIHYAPTNQDRMLASKSMARHLPAPIKRKQWLGNAIFFALLILLGYAFLHDHSTVSDFVDKSMLFAPEVGDNDNALVYWENWSAAFNQAQRSLTSLIYWFAAPPLLVASYMFWRWQQWAQQVFTPLDGRQFTLTLSPEGLRHEEANQQHAFYHWAAVPRIIRERDYLLFYTDKNVAHFVSLRCFADEAAADAFYQQALAFKEAAQN